MSSDVKIPDAVMIEAERVNDEIFRIAHDEVHILNHTQRKAAIARAIQLAEQRGRKAGLEEAADHLEQMAKDTPLGHENIQRGRSTYNWLRFCEAAIRSLGEKT